MRTVEELRDASAQMLVDLRSMSKKTKAQMAEAMECDVRTYSAYEAGKSVPDIATFSHLFAELGVSALRPVLDYLYPDTYKDLSPESDIEHQRAALVRWISEIAPERAIHELNFLLFGRHGSNAAAQLNEFMMIDHLPMSCRLIVAELVNSFYNLAAARGELVGTEADMPNVELFREGLQKGREAAIEGRNSYTTLIEK